MFPAFRRLERADRRLFSSLAALPNRGTGRGLRLLSRAADHGALWLAVAAVLAATRGRRGRRAALRALLSLAASSAIVNQPAKRLSRRTRPSAGALGAAQLIRRRPLSSSFPSGHAASAFAFATGAALESPVLAVPLLAAAAAVSASRITVGAHYPGDVAAGALAGAGVALATSRVWPVAPRTPQALNRSLQYAAERPSDRGDGLVIAVNAGAGQARGGDVRELLMAELPEARFVDPGEGDVAAALAAELDGARTIGVAGGDGTANTGAGVAVAAGLPLLVVPAGTLNHLARDLGLEAPEEAVAALRAGTLARVDVGRIAGEPFLNTASLGSYVEMVTARERLEGRIGKWPAMVVALVRVLRRGTAVEVEIDGRRRRVWLAFFGNCAYHPQGFAPSWRERLDDGLVDVRLLDASLPWSRTRLVTAVLTGRLGRCRVHEQWMARRVAVRSLQGALPLARDGEVFDGPESFSVEKDVAPLLIFAHREVSGNGAG